VTAVFQMSNLEGVCLTYPRPRHPNLLATSRCKSPSKRDLSSGEKESGNSTFWGNRWTGSGSWVQMMSN